MGTSRVTRRRLLQFVSSGAVAAAVGRPGWAMAGAGGGPAWLRRSVWDGAVGRAVVVTATGQRLHVVAVRDLHGTSPTGRPLAGRDDAFAAVMSHAPDAPVAQGVHGLASAVLGTFRALVVPERPGRCVVVVNRTA